MANFIEGEDRQALTPKAQIDAFSFLGTLRPEHERDSELRRSLGSVELGNVEKETLRTWAQQLNTLGLLPKIRSADFSWDPSDEIEDFNDEIEGEEPRAKKALWVHFPSPESDEDAVVMDENGQLLRGYGASNYSGRIIAFDFESAEKLSLEEYPSYFTETEDSVRQMIEDATGITEARRLQQEKDILNAKIAEIDSDNEKYGGITDFGTSERQQKATEFVTHILSIRNLAERPNSGITPDRLENLLHRFFKGQEIFNSGEFDLVNPSGGIELSLIAGSLVADLDLEIGSKLHELGTEMLKFSNSSYLVRRSFQVPYQNESEDKKIYNAFALNRLRRIQSTGNYDSDPVFCVLPDKFETEEGEGFTAAEIRDWLLSPQTNSETDL